jgi:hypothetical protein
MPYDPDRDFLWAIRIWLVLVAIIFLTLLLACMRVS